MSRDNDNEVQVELLNTEEMLALGLRLMGESFHTSRKRNLSHKRQVAKFVSRYGAHPQTLSLIWCDLHTTEETRVQIMEFSPQHFLVAYQWMRGYDSEIELHNETGFPEKLIRDWCKSIPFLVAKLRATKIDAYWEDDEDGYGNKLW